MTPLQTKTAISIMGMIEYWVKNHSTMWIDYSNWYIGITKNTKIRKANHTYEIKGAPYFFLHKCAHSVDIARAIETHFHKKGMREKDTPGGIKEDSWYVYVFKKYPTIFD